MRRSDNGDGSMQSLPGLAWSGLRREIDLRQALREQVMSLSFHGFEHLIRLLLIRMGYEDVRLAGRIHARAGGE